MDANCCIVRDRLPAGWPALVLGIWLGAGCVAEPELLPAPQATLAPGTTDVALANVAGVAIWADGRVWDGDPLSLPQVLTPVRVGLDNHSGHTLRIAYRSFTLVGDSGFHYAALPPFSIHGEVSEVTRASVPAVLASTAAEPANPPVARPPPPRPARVVPVHPRYPPRGFHVAYPYRVYYPGFGWWPHPWAWDPLYYGYWYAYWPRPLPSQDMLERALPEGVLDDGGSMSGYLYFQRVTRESKVRLEVELRDAADNEIVGTAALPFVVSR